MVSEYQAIEARALRQFITLKPECKDAYRQIILFPIQAMGNIYEMYYAQAMNLKLAAQGDPEANCWAERCRQAFKRDSLLNLQYNKEIAGGKWDGMMTQKHISYKDWNDWFPADVCPELKTVETPAQGPVFTASNGYVSIEAEHSYSRTDAQNAKWTVIPYMGRTLSGVALMPYTTGTENATLEYRWKGKADKVKVHVVTKSTLDFLDKGLRGSHRRRTARERELQQPTEREAREYLQHLLSYRRPSRGGADRGTACRRLEGNPYADPAPAGSWHRVREDCHRSGRLSAPIPLRKRIAEEL